MNKKMLSIVFTIIILSTLIVAELPAAASSDSVYLSRDMAESGLHNVDYASQSQQLCFSSAPGVYYSHGIVSSGWPSTSASYIINGKYSTFTGIYGHIGTTGGSCDTTITGDGKVLAVLNSKSGDIPKEFFVDVTGVSILGISMSASGDHWLWYPTFAIANPLLGTQSAAQTYFRGYPCLRVFNGSYTPSNGNASYIGNANQLAAIGGEQSDGKYYILATDIALTGNWTPIEDFRGTLDGAGHVITGMSATTNLSGQSAGLFGTISKGNATIKNLGIKSGYVTASVRLENCWMNTANLYAGGLVGRCTGGSLIIENCYYDGIVSVSAKQFNVTEAALSLAISKILPNIGTAVNEVRDELVSNIIPGDTSNAFAGGLIGSVDGNATVTINNSYTRGSVYAYSETGDYVRGTGTRSYAGGLVGYKDTGSRALDLGTSGSVVVAGSSQSKLTVGYCYSAANAAADTWRNPGDIFRIVAPQNLYAGGLFGSGNPDTTTGSNYRSNVQAVLGSSGKINNTGTPLSHAAMQNSSSFVGWDFSNVWTNDSIEPEKPSSTFDNGFSCMRGSDETITLIIDKDISQFNNVSVDGNALTQNAHYTITSGSTKVMLLPGYLDSLRDGFHSLTVTYKDSTSVEEHFVIIETSQIDIPSVDSIYIGDTLIYSNGNVLVDVNYLRSLLQGAYKLKVNFANGHIVDEFIDTGSTDKPSTWATDEVNSAITAGLVPRSLMSKYTNQITRAEYCALAVMLYEKYTGLEITQRKTFGDTNDVNVQKMAAVGVVEGVGNNIFNPGGLLTREQAATMLSRLANALGKPLAKQIASFTDNNKIASWAIDGVGQVQAAGIMAGVGNNTFAPKNPYTREQSIITMIRLWNAIMATP